MDNNISPSYIYDYVHLTPQEQVGLHSQESWEIDYVIKGEGLRLVGTKTEPFHQGEVMLIPPGTPHCFYFNNEVTDHRGRICNITLMMNNSLLEVLGTIPEIHSSIECFKQKRNTIVFTNKKSKQIANYLLDMKDIDNASRIAILIKIILLMSDDADEHIVATHPDSINRKQSRITQIHTYVRCNIKHEITLSEIANHIGMNRTAFCAFFKKETGLTFVNYLNRQRIQVAHRLLLRTELSISDICYEVGFNDIPYFNRIFKKLSNCTPSEYRLTHHHFTASAKKTT